MSKKVHDVDMDAVYVPSQKIVARMIQEKLIIVPIEDGIADLNDAMFSFNETGTKIWEGIEAKKSLNEISAAFVTAYDADIDEINSDVAALVETLLNKGMVEKWTR